MRSISIFVSLGVAVGVIACHKPAPPVDEALDKDIRAASEANLALASSQRTSDVATVSDIEAQLQAAPKRVRAPKKDPTPEPIQPVASPNKVESSGQEVGASTPPVIAETPVAVAEITPTVVSAPAGPPATRPQPVDTDVAVAGPGSGGGEPGPEMDPVVLPPERRPPGGVIIRGGGSGRDDCEIHAPPRGAGIGVLINNRIPVGGRIPQVGTGGVLGGRPGSTGGFNPGAAMPRIRGGR